MLVFIDDAMHCMHIIMVHACMGVRTPDGTDVSLDVIYHGASILEHEGPQSAQYI